MTKPTETPEGDAELIRTIEDLLGRSIDDNQNTRRRLLEECDRHPGLYTEDFAERLRTQGTSPKSSSR